jgi:hypothetical protein
MEPSGNATGWSKRTPKGSAVCFVVALDVKTILEGVPIAKKRQFRGALNLSNHSIELPPDDSIDLRGSGSSSTISLSSFSYFVIIHSACVP